MSQQQSESTENSVENTNEVQQKVESLKRTANEVSYH